MAFITNLTNQMGEVIRSQSMARRMIALAIILLSVGALAFMVVRAQTGGWTVLYTGLQASDAGDAVQKLNQLSISTKVDNGGTTIKVPANKVDQAMVLLAQEGIPNSGTVGWEVLDKSRIGQSKQQEEKNFQRMLEGELTRTLKSISEIEGARVHLALPEPSLFVKDVKQPTASVILKLRRGAKLSERQMMGVVHMVSYAVEGLLPENVALIDQYGNQLSHAKDSDSSRFSAAQAAFKTEWEEEQKQRIESLLSAWLGRDKVSARVQADFDFASLHTIDETYNPLDQDPIINSQQQTYEGRPDGAGSKAGGAPGSTKNVPDLANAGNAQAAGAGQGNVRQDSTTQYSVSRQWKESTNNVPQPTRVTVAVLVDGQYEEITTGDKKGQKEFKALPAQDITKIEDMVKATIGYVSDGKRQDVVTVNCVPFQVDEVRPEEKTFLTYEMQKLIEQIIQWGVVGVIGLLLVLLVLRPAIKQVLVSPAFEGQRALPAEGPAFQALIEGGELPEGIAQRSAASSSGGEKAPRQIASGGNAAGAKSSGGNMAALLGDGGNEMLQLQQMAAQQAKLSSQQAAQVQKEILDTAKSNPQKTVSLLRQWMEEA